MEVNIELGFKLFNGILLIKGNVNDLEGYFAFDTGSKQTSINSKHCKVSNPTDKEVTVYDSGLKTINILTGTVDYLEAGHLCLENHSVISLDLSYVEEKLKAKKNSLKFLGTIGMDIISQYVVRIDYPNNIIILNPDTDFLTSHSVDFNTSNKVITLPVILEGTTYQFMLDTGASACLIDKKILGIDWEIVDKEQNSYFIPSISIGALTFHKILTVVDSATIIKSLEVDGIIGYPILSQQRIDMNFKSNKLIFEKV